MQVVVTSSEDASVMVWDYESGEFERCLRGHTGSVNDVAFSSTGALLCMCVHLQLRIHICAYVCTCMFMCIYVYIDVCICRLVYAYLQV